MTDRRTDRTTDRTTDRAGDRLSDRAGEPVMARQLSDAAPERPRAGSGRVRLLGPAFVAAIAYVDPGNVATNTAAGADFGYLLLWVLVGATVMAGLVQYLSAKVGLVTGRSLPELVGARNTRPARLAYWVQAEAVAMATDLAEIVGGTIALQLLFGLPVLAGGLIVVLASTGLLVVQDRTGQRTFERVITGLLVVVTIGFLTGLVFSPPHPAAAAAGLMPRLQGGDSALLAVGMLGATVMPHAVYVHSALVRDRHGRPDAAGIRRLLPIVRLDVVLAMVVAGGVNVGMLLLAADALFRPGFRLPDTNGLITAHAELAHALGPVIATSFALALLASGLASTSVGGYAGAVIMGGLLYRRVPMLVRRTVTAVPALVLLAVGVDPTRMLILSQVALSFGLPFALIPLIRIVSDKALVAAAPTRPATVVLGWLVVAVVVALNLLLVVLTAVSLG